jgi:CRP/FNR family cyclic AMP-dependent transcriptional regulator
MTQTVINVLEADPDLADGLGRGEAALARGYALARKVTLRPGRWRPQTAHNPGDMGFLVLEGVLMRSTVLSNDRTGIELIGDGDLIRPWEQSWSDGSVRTQVRWRAITDTKLAELDHRFVARIGRWPTITAALTERASRRADRMGIIDAVAHATRVDIRLLVLLWCLADRWGRVHSDGTVLPFELTQGELAALIGAQRPSVSAALKELNLSGLLVRHDTGGWLLPTSADGSASATLPASRWERRWERLPRCVIEKVRARLGHRPSRHSARPPLARPSLKV